jgi:hypothetical protein
MEVAVLGIDLGQTCTRGTLTSTAPNPIMIDRSGRWPWRTKACGKRDWGLPRLNQSEFSAWVVSRTPTRPPDIRRETAVWLDRDPQARARCGWRKIPAAFRWPSDA